MRVTLLCQALEPRWHGPAQLIFPLCHVIGLYSNLECLVSVIHRFPVMWMLTAHYLCQSSPGWAWDSQGIFRAWLLTPLFWHLFKEGLSCHPCSASGSHRWFNRCSQQRHCVWSQSAEERWPRIERCWSTWPGASEARELYLNCPCICLGTCHLGA